MIFDWLALAPIRAANLEGNRVAAMEGSLRLFVPDLLDRTAALYRRAGDARDAKYAAQLKGAEALFADLSRYQREIDAAVVVAIRARRPPYRAALDAVAGALEYLNAERDGGRDPEARRRTLNRLVGETARLDAFLNPWVSP
ncbi:MAG TPA: hypothetical protein VFX30_07185 [bacterium]|nr:hypothetical protein [bacterium]